MNILSYNPGHDGAVAHVRDGHLISSIEAEKDSNYRYTPIGSREMLDAFGRVEEVPDVVCTPNLSTCAENEDDLAIDSVRHLRVPARQ